MSNKYFEIIKIVTLIIGTFYSSIYFFTPDVIAADNPVLAQAMPEMHTDHSGMDMPPVSNRGPDNVETTSDVFTSDTAGLPDAVPTGTVDLKNGDSYDITASYVKKAVGGRSLRMLAYNGSVPGPFIKAPQNSEITIYFTNNTDIDQTIHSHGVRIDNRYDGVPNMTQNSVRPGETYTYVVKFRDAGVYWYHPHTREDYGQEMGLYGNYIITPAKKAYWSQVNREIPLVIDDILIENDRVADFYKEFTNYALLGRFGNEFLVNGQTDFVLNVKKGEVIRFFLTNVSNAKTYNLSFPGIQTKLVGADLGKYEHEIFKDNFLISPGERVVVEAYFKTPGTYQLTHTQPDGKIQLTTIRVSADEAIDKSHADTFAILRHNDEDGKEFKEIRKYLDVTPDKKLLLSINIAGQSVDHAQHAHMQPEEVLNNQSEHAMGEMEDHSQHQTMTPADEALMKLQWSDPTQSDKKNRTPEISWKLIDEDSGKVNENINDWKFKVGDLVKIRLTNNANADHSMQHPVHFHGQQFVVLAEDGIANNDMVWKDTVLVFPGQTIDILVMMSNPGMWMAHCHVPEHLNSGMMLTFRVEDKNGHATGDEYRRTTMIDSHGHH